MSNKRFKYGACIWSLPLSGPEVCAYASQIGLEGLELDMGDYEDGLPLSGLDLQNQYLKAGAASGISFMTLGANTLCSHGMSKKEDNPVVRKIFQAIVETAVAMNIPKLQLPSFTNGFITNEEEFKNTVENLKIICDLAEAHGLLVGTENAISAEENIRLAETVNRSNLRFYFDTSNPFWLGNGMYSPSMIPVMADLICEYHVKDQVKNNEGNRFVLLGKGDSTFLAAAEQLLTTDYEGWILLENDYIKNLTEEDLKKDIATLHNVFD